MKEVLKRASSSPPPFFRRLRNLGVALVSISAAILTAPVSLPTLLVTFAGYAAVAGSVLSAVCQLVQSDETQ